MVLLLGAFLDRSSRWLEFGWRMGDRAPVDLQVRFEKRYSSERSRSMSVLVYFTLFFTCNLIMDGCRWKYSYDKSMK